MNEEKPKYKTVREAALNSPSMLRENYYSRSEKSAYLYGAEYGAKWQLENETADMTVAYMVGVSDEKDRIRKMIEAEITWCGECGLDSEAAALKNLINKL